MMFLRTAPNQMRKNRIIESIYRFEKGRDSRRHVTYRTKLRPGKCNKSEHVLRYSQSLESRFLYRKSISSNTCQMQFGGGDNEVSRKDWK